jgi:hypothetical protein
MCRTARSTLGYECDEQLSAAANRGQRGGGPPVSHDRECHQSAEAGVTYQSKRCDPSPEGRAKHQPKTDTTGGPPGDRTLNPRIKSPLLCQLS